MMRRSLILMAIVAAALCKATDAQATGANEPPVLPAGLDAYRMWDRWPYQRIGQRAYMRSTYDRSGGNEGADASHFLYQIADDFNVALDVQGPGILYFARYNHWHGSPWHYVVDGSDHMVKESSTANPAHPVEHSTFEPRAAFPKPLAWTWSDTRGADLMWAPIGFERSFQMAYSRTHYGTGYYIYDQFVPGAKLSAPIKAWDGKTPPDRDVLELISRAGGDLLAGRAGLSKVERTIDIPGGRAAGAIEIGDGPAMLRGIEITAPKESAIDLGTARLRIWWDDRPLPSVDAPVALFFGAGTLYNRDHRADFVRAFPVNIHFSNRQVALNCYFPMPFFRSARIELVGADAAIKGVHITCRYEPYRDPPNHVGYFHATYADHPLPVAGADMVLLDTRQEEGGGDWSGSFVGTSFIFSHDANLNTLEGDPRFYFDDSLTPQGQGTGTEEWGGGGDYWGGRNMTLPFAGHPCGAHGPAEAVNELDKIESAYRFLLADLMPFGRNARITLEHGGTNESVEHYETVTYWYGLPAPSLLKSDVLSIGDEASERAHAYVSPRASAPYEISSRYEWGVDHLAGKEIFPARSDRGRTTAGTSEFTVRLEPNNLGVLLRRKLDYQYPNQRAFVWVADADASGKASGPFKAAGIWYLAGSNTCVYSNPQQELGPTEHVVETSNRRFRDDEFLIGRDLTKGRHAIRLRIRFTPVHTPLFPGNPLPELAWSEMRYTAYCYALPIFTTPKQSD
ncbi:MAG TPA: DUF2961 domain-containing protein [Tepidisphaeraceae bacterium]|nr:DUF2961 domain-containing protein [Tepidisphaeraceae bacterium]